MIRVIIGHTSTFSIRQEISIDQLVACKGQRTVSHAQVIVVCMVTSLSFTSPVSDWPPSELATEVDKQNTNSWLASGQYVLGITTICSRPDKLQCRSLTIFSRYWALSISRTRTFILCMTESGTLLSYNYVSHYSIPHPSLIIGGQLLWRKSTLTH